MAKVFFFFRVYGPRRSRGPVEVHKHTHKKRTKPISSHLDRTNLVNKGFIVWLLGKFSSETRRVIPSGQDTPLINRE